MMSMAGERFGRAKSAVFWDLKGCKIPDGENAVEVSQKIRAALKKLNYHGTTTIYAYGDTKKMEADLESSGYVVKQHTPAGDTVEDYRGTASIYAFGDTNQMKPEIVFNHVSEGDPERSTNRVLTDSLCWALDNPTPANLLLIVGSISEFRYAGYFLKLEAHYNLLVAQPQNASGDQLPSASASATWLWESLSVGGDPLPEPLKPKRKLILLPPDETGCQNLWDFVSDEEDPMAETVWETMSAQDADPMSAFAPRDLIAFFYQPIVSNHPLDQSVKTMSALDVNRKSPFVADPMSIFALGKTYVLWDVEDCPIPPGLSATDVFVNIETFLKERGHYGRVSIMPCGDLDHLKNDFVGIPVSILDSEGNREDRLKRFLLDLFILPIREHHQPLNLMLIVGDINSERKDLDFFEVFRLLKSRSSYKIILAQSPNPSEEKLSLTIDGLREGLSAGQDLITNKL